MRIVWAPTREMSRLAEQPANEFHPNSSVWIHPKLGGHNSNGRASRYRTDLVPTTDVCPVTYTENLSHDWTSADYPFNLVSHVRHEGVPSFSVGEWGIVTVCTEAYATYVLRIPSDCTQMDLSTHCGVYFFDFTEWHYRIRIYGRLLRANVPGYSRSVHLDTLALRSRHDYDNNVHNSTIYL